MSKKAYKQAISDIESPIGIPGQTGVYNDEHGILSADKVLHAISKYGLSQFKETLKGIFADKLFIAFLTLSIGGFTYVGVREYLNLRQYYTRLRQEEKSRAISLARYKREEEQKLLTSLQENDTSASGSESGLKTPTTQELSSDNATNEQLQQSGVNNRKRTSRRRGGPSLTEKLARLLRIAIPGPTSYTAQLLIVQFCMLVSRTFLSINCVKNSISAITHAIAGASWKWWVRWLTNFSMWMCGGIIINSGLRMGESLIALNIRKSLTEAIHTKYFNGINYYKINTAPPTSSSTAAAVGSTTDATPSSSSQHPASATHCAIAQPSHPSGGTPSSSLTSHLPSIPQSPIAQAVHVSNIENRIVRDVASFSDNIAFLYGHSFKPILEFALSLTEASTDLGFKRPLALFAVSIVINLAMRKLSPHLGKMIAIESENEGQLQQSHTRIAAHIEEIAFMGGGASERVLISEKFNELTFTKVKHTLMRVRKSVADNVVKFSGLLVGGIFVHIPFLLSPGLTPAQRISSFRGTEEVMLRCGSAFSEILLLGKELQEIGGHCDRIIEVVDALEICDKANDVTPTLTGDGDNNNNAQQQNIVCTSGGLSKKPLSKIEQQQEHYNHRATPSSNNLSTLGLQHNSKSTDKMSLSTSSKGLRKSVSGMLIDDNLSCIEMNHVTVIPPEDQPRYVSWYLETTGNDTASTDIDPSLHPTNFSTFPGRVLLANLNLRIPRGRSVLITGPNGSGKTSLFRCLAGLWPIGSGYINRPSGGVLMVPQNPYLIYGTLRDNVTYPLLYRLQDSLIDNNNNKNGKKTNNPLDKLLSQFTSIVTSDQTSQYKNNDGTSQVLYITQSEMDDVDKRVVQSMSLACGANIIRQQSEGLYTVCAWDSKLSGGERQKVGLARVFYHRPVYALLDESTSAVHPGDEAKMYSNVTNAGITVFSIAHRPALRAYHQLELIFLADGQGGYIVKDLHHTIDNHHDHSHH